MEILPFVPLAYSLATDRPMFNRLSRLRDSSPGRERGPGKVPAARTGQNGAAWVAQLNSYEIFISLALGLSRTPMRFEPIFPADFHQVGRAWRSRRAGLCRYRLSSGCMACFEMMRIQQGVMIMDFIVVGIGVVFFAISFFYVRLCEFL
jgi:hypothetical protein